MGRQLHARGEHFLQIWRFYEFPFWTFGPEREWDGQTDGRTVPFCNNVPYTDGRMIIGCLISAQK